jgi:hypothetical protein
MDTIPVQLEQLLSLALGVVFVTQGLKAAAKAIDVKVKGKGAVVVSALGAAVLTGIAYGAGWVPIPALPTPEAYADPFTWARAWLATAGGVPAPANLLYVAVYGRVFGAEAAISAPSTA